MNGNVLWNKSINVPPCKSLYATQFVDVTFDGGIVAAGVVYVCGRRSDLILYKLDSSGNLVWIKSYGTGGFIDLASVSRTKDQGYVFLFSLSGTLSNIVLKVDSKGELNWYKEFYSTAGTPIFAKQIHQTGDGGYAISDPRGKLIRLDAQGNFRWLRLYKIRNADIALNSFVQATDGGFILAGGAFPFQKGHLFVTKVDARGMTNSPCVQVSNGSRLSYRTVQIKEHPISLTLQDSQPFILDTTTSITNLISKESSCAP